MTAPDRPDIESTLTEAFSRRHAAQRAARPSLVDVRRRAHRRATRNAAARTGAVMAAGAAVVTGGWAVTQRDSSPAAGPAVPVNEVAPSDGSADQIVTTLSVDGLWNAVAAQLGVSVEDLRRANPSVDFGRAPVPGTPIAVPVDAFRPGVPTTSPAPQTTFIVTAPPTTTPSPTFVNVLTTPPTTGVVPTTTTGRVIAGTTDTTTQPEMPEASATTVTMVSGPGHECGPLTDEQIDALVDAVRRIGTTPNTTSNPGATVPLGCLGVPSVPEGWTLYQIATGDYLYGVAERFCATADELVAGNGWAAGVNVPLHPGQLIAVPADAC